MRRTWKPSYALLVNVYLALFLVVGLALQHPRSKYSSNDNEAKSHYNREGRESENETVLRELLLPRVSSYRPLLVRAYMQAGSSKTLPERGTL